MDSRTLQPVVLLLLLATSIPAEEARTVFGVPEELKQGAEALRTGDYQSGVELTLKGLAGELTRRNRAAALSNLCAGYHGLGRYAEALEACTRSLALDDRNWRVWHNRALTYLDLGEPEAAWRDIERGLTLSPNATRLLDLLERAEIERSRPQITLEEQRDAGER